VVAVRDHFAPPGDDHEASISPVVITFADDPARLAAYRDHLGVGIPVLADADRALYELLGAGRTSYTRVWNAGTLAMYGRLLASGRRLQRPRDDTRQLGADALIDAEGRLRRVWLPTSPDARPTVAELAAAARSTA
jgi:hypothetical protein